MARPHCAATTTTELPKPTQLGYCIFRCKSCQRQVNERTGTQFNVLDLPTDIVLLVLLWRVRYKLSLRALAEMFLERGFASFDSASRFCRAFDDQRQYSRLRPAMGQPLAPLSEQRREHRARFQALKGELMAA